VLGILEGKRVAFLARHGRGHRILPSEINYRANVYAMKLLGVERIISVSAVGSLKEDLRPGRISGRRPVFRPHKEPALYIFWRGTRCSPGVCTSHMRAIVGRPGGCLRGMRP